MCDTRKCFRGVLLWREDVLKCEKVVRKPLSEFVREMLHSEMDKHRLGEDGERELAEQIERAKARRSERKTRATKRTAGRSVAVDVMPIPESVRKNPRFVKA